VAAQNQLRSTILHAFATTTPPPLSPEPPPGEDGSPDIVIDLVDRLSTTPVGDGGTFASIPPPAATVLPMAGDVVGQHYKLGRRLGEGTFGQVWVAQRIDVPEHQVALKILPRSLYVGRNVERELVMLATVGHPHVVQLKDHGTTDEYVWLTMPVYQGETLHERLQSGPLSLREAYDIFRTMAYGLEALHDLGLRHQDIKPDNIFLAVFGARIHPVLLDLGVAAEKDATFVAGTALYASPEQIFALDARPDKPPLTEKMDTYCFATTLLMSLVGPQFFPGEKAELPSELGDALVERATNPIAKDALPDLGGAARQKLITVLKSWLALDPRDRPGMSEVAEQIDVLLEKEREEKRLEELAKERQKAALLRFRIGALVAVLFAAAVAVYVVSKRETLRLAGELERAQREGAASFDKLDTCVASHKMASGEAATCKAEREKERAQIQQTIDVLSKKGAGSEKLDELQTLVRSYSGRLRICEDGATADKKQCAEDAARLTAAAEREKTALSTARDEQKALVEARDKELATARADRDTCIDQKAQILIACSGAKAAGGATAGTAGPAGGAPAGTGAAAAPGTTAGSVPAVVTTAATAPAPKPPPPPPNPDNPL
jgi:serine/threonine protein kinase